MTIDELKQMAATIRCDIIEMIYEAQAGHPGGSLSATDIVTALYFRVMRIDPKNPDWPDRDRFILSKGHACPVWYAALAERGYYDKAHLRTLRKLNSILQGHADMIKTPGVDMTVGSLGQGLVGRAGHGAERQAAQQGLPRLGRRRRWRDARKARSGKRPWPAPSGSWIISRLSSISTASRTTLSVDDVMPIDPLADKWRAFGWNVIEIDGHDMEQIVAALETAKTTKGMPTVIIAHTVKGKGVSFMENVPDWHGRRHRMPSSDEIGPGRDQRRVHDARRITLSLSSGLRSWSVLALTIPSPGREPGRPPAIAYAEAILEVGGQIPERGGARRRRLQIDQHHGCSHERFPDREFNFGIAEQNMMAAAAGMATTGLIPFASTYAVFASMRALDQVRNSIHYPAAQRQDRGQPRRHHARPGRRHPPGAGRPVHYALASPIPPSSRRPTPVTCKMATWAAADYDGPVYLSFTRDPVPLLYTDDYPFEIGKAVWCEKGSDVTIVAMRDLVAASLVAAERLAREGHERARDRLPHAQASG